MDKNYFPIIMALMIFAHQEFSVAASIPLTTHPNGLPSAAEARVVAGGSLNHAGIELQNPIMGDDYEWFSISDNKFLIDERVEDLSELYEPRGLWTFPVIAKGKADFFLTTHYRKGQWRTQLVNDPQVGSVLKGIAEAWPRSEGYNFKLVHASILGVRLIEISRYGEILGFIRFDKEVEGLNPGVLKEPKEMAAEVQDIVKGFAEGRRGR